MVDHPPRPPAPQQALARPAPPWWAACDAMTCCEQGWCECDARALGEWLCDREAVRCR